MEVSTEDIEMEDMMVLEMVVVMVVVVVMLELVVMGVVVMDMVLLVGEEEDIEEIVDDIVTLLPEVMNCLVEDMMGDDNRKVLEVDTMA